MWPCLYHHGFPMIDYNDPYVICEERVQFNVKMNQIVTGMVQRDRDGNCDCWWPPEEALILAYIECEDGMIFLYWQPPIKK